MDKTDVSPIMLLSQESRISYAELADKLNLSVNPVQKRIHLFIQTGVVCKFTAKISLFADVRQKTIISTILRLFVKHCVGMNLNPPPTIYLQKKRESENI